MNRYAARELVTFDRELSPGAARLYAALDEYARDSGVCWPRQRTIADRLGCPVRTLQFWLAQLVSAELVMVERSTPGGPNRYRLYHAQQVAPPSAMDCATLAQQVAPLQIHAMNTQIPLTPASGGILPDLIRQTYPSATAEEVQAAIDLYSVCPACDGAKSIGRSQKRQRECPQCQGRGFLWRKSA